MNETVHEPAQATPEAAESEQHTSSETPAYDLPEDVIIILPVRGVVLFPDVVLPLTIGRRRSILAAQEAVKSNGPIGIIQQRDPHQDLPNPDDLHAMGTVANVLRYVTSPDGTHHIICQGLRRFRIVEFVPGYPFFAARVENITVEEHLTPELEARTDHMRRQALEAIELVPQAPAELAETVQAVKSPGSLCDLVTSFMDLKAAEKQEILEIIDVEARVKRVAELLAQRLAVLRLSHEIERQTRETVDRRQREFLLREQLKTIQRELGEDEPRAAEHDELARAIEEAGMPAEAEEQALRELSRLERMSEAASEYSMLRTYLDWMVALPWNKLSEAEIDIARARTILDEDHYGLEKVKRRILEYLAVLKLNPEGRSPILCLVGPPGVGKTSLGQSIARATGRAFVRVALGGVHDESEIRGHRRTYVGALPGNIVHGLRKAGTRNPVFMLDEMDKLGAGFHGDPSAALLEVLDPEQNSTFRDNYIAVPFDLSRVVFIATANMADTIPRPLLDRMETIALPGYTDEEKMEIAKRYLVRRQLEATGLTAGQCTLTEAALRAIVDEYTREAGVRNLEREIGNVFRHVAMRVAEGETAAVTIDAADLSGILGPRKFESEVAMRVSVPGVATGLAWTPVGGDILFIEAARSPGNGKLILTGQLGDVMKESAQAALSLAKNRWESLGIDQSIFAESDLHIHVPAGAIPKDGPSAGVAMYTALVSLLTGRTVRKDTAMTGEISLRGLVLPVGGIKEKALAAARAGITTVLLPARNRIDLEDVPESARKLLNFVLLENVDDAIEAAFGAPLEK
ncbi:MAG: endopeptidase La [Gammaproteobacteria bacterium]|jgi:ATP-dependent Lon protease|nr:endopeptidase La [Gammaproteobacteria bacterium]